MKVNVKDEGKCYKRLKIELSKNILETAFENYYLDLKKKTVLPGFRKGKVPREIIEEHFSSQANEEVLSKVINDGYQEALKKENIFALALPKIENINLQENDNLFFDVVVEVRPVFGLKKYKGLKLEKKLIEISEQEIDAVILDTQKRHAEFIPVQRTVQVRDLIICDVSFSAAGKVIEKKENYSLFVSTEMLMPGFAENIIGMAVNEKKEFSMLLPEKFNLQDIAGKNAVFNIFVKEIKEEKLPEINDEFARILGEKSLKEFKTRIKDSLAEGKEAAVKKELKNQICKHLLKAMPIDVPGSMLIETEKKLKDNLARNLKQKGYDDQKIEQELQKSQANIQQSALNDLRIFFILNEIGNQEKIEVSQDEIKAKVADIAYFSKMKEKDVWKRLENKDRMDQLSSDIIIEKTIDFVLKNAEISEVGNK